jgi:hypothetical protein
MQYFKKIGGNANWQKYLADEHASVQAGEQSIVGEEVAEYVHTPYVNAYPETS